MSLPLLDDLPVVLSEEEFDIACEKRLRSGAGCSAPAEWIVRCRHCSAPTFLCGRHLAFLRDAHNHWTCSACKADSFVFDLIAEVTKLWPGRF